MLTSQGSTHLPKSRRTPAESELESDSKSEVKIVCLFICSLLHNPSSP